MPSYRASSTPKWLLPSNQKRLDKACDYLSKIKDKGAADWEKVGKILGLGVAASRQNLKKFRQFEYNEYIESLRYHSRGGLLGSETSKKLSAERNQRMKDLGFDKKAYFAYLQHTCQNKATTTVEIRLLNSTIQHAIDENKPESELTVLRAKRGMAKRHFMSLRY